MHAFLEQVKQLKKLLVKSPSGMCLVPVGCVWSQWDVFGPNAPVSVFNQNGLCWVTMGCAQLWDVLSVELLRLSHMTLRSWNFHVWPGGVEFLDICAKLPRGHKYFISSGHLSRTPPQGFLTSCLYPQLPPTSSPSLSLSPPTHVLSPPLCFS